jgi:DinB superfamily
MADLHATVVAVLCDRYRANAARICELASAFTDAEFWQNPFPFGNSFGHLVLHLTGNLNYYIGTQIAKTGYVRDRPREFSDSNPPSKDEALHSFNDAVAMVLRTIQEQTPDDWAAAYSGVATDCKNRLAMVVQCAAHMQHHIGQMIYLAHALQRQDEQK